MSVDEREILTNLNIGSRTAEDEVDRLEQYFVETENWRKVWEDEVDIIFAPKGGGKSAIYQMLLKRSEKLKDRNIMLVAAENPSGNTVFQTLSSDTALSEAEFERIWLLYFLVLITNELEKKNIRDSELRNIREALESIGLDASVTSPRNILTIIKDRIKAFFQAPEIGVTVDPTSGMTQINARLKFDQPNADELRKGVVSVDDLFDALETVLDRNSLTFWILLDRLDVSFASVPDLERVALRSLFKAYANLRRLKRVKCKIFLRTDIWRQISEGGFRELSHIERDLSLKWDENTLRSVLVQRLLQSERLVDALNLEPQAIEISSDRQKALLGEISPDQVESGEKKKPTAFDWVLSRIEDGNEIAVPREMIHFYSQVRSIQLRRIETGESIAAFPRLFDVQAFRDAWPIVSETRLTQTIYAEYSDVKDWLELLRGAKATQNEQSLSEIWNTSEEETFERINRLLEIGFFKRKKEYGRYTYWVPFLYRPGLEMVQGAAEGVRDRSEI